VAEDKDKEEFREALANYVNQIRAKRLDYNFVDFVFVGTIDFQKHLGVTVLENAEFRGARFHGDVYFWETQFHGSAGFALAHFYGDTRFERVKFHGEVRFALTQFKSVSFRETRFRGEARFNGTSFFKKASFLRTGFEGGADFERVIFGGDVEFHKAQFWPTSCISVEFAKGRVSFAKANLENVSLTPLKLRRSAYIDFTGATLRNTQMKREDIEDHIVDEREKHFCKARETYLLLKNNFRSLGRYADESWAFTKEKEMERKSFRHFRKEHKEKELGKGWIDKDMRDCFRPFLLDLSRLARFVGGNWFPNWRSPRNTVIKLCSALGDFLEQPGVTIETGFNRMRSFVLEDAKGEAEDVSCPEFLEALWFYIKYPVKYCWSTFLKWLYGWGEWPWLIIGWCGVAIFVFSLVYLGGNIRASDGTLVQSYLDRLYFSGITFTTLGFGGYSPVGGLRFWAFLESFLGIFFIALFVFSFARRTAGR